jgi:hypothetical protein
MKNYKKVEHLLIKRIYYVKAKNKVEAESLIENGAYNNVVDENMEPKEEKQDLVKRKCFACGKEKAMGKFERYCCDSCRSRATRYYQAPNSLSW